METPIDATSDEAAWRPHRSSRPSAIGLVSADSHVNEPRDLWSSNLPPSLRHQAIRGIESGDDGGWNLVFDGEHIFQRSMADEESRLEVLDPLKRMDVMRSEGIVAECIFPTIGLYVWMLEDPDGGAASCRVYNEWILDQLQSASPRFCCAGLVPTWSPDQAIAEITFIAESGLRALMLPTVATPSWNRSEWLGVWDHVAATGLPVVMHQGTGHDMVWYGGRGATVANLIATQTMAPRTATMLATSGILAAHPDLHVVFVEYNVGWLAWTMETADYYDAVYRRYDEFRPTRSGRPSVNPVLPEPPSHYLRRQVHATFQVDATGLGNVERSGADALMWGSDFPHEEGTYPNSRDIVDRLGGALAVDVTRKVFRANAIRVFRFDEQLLDQPF